MRREKQKIIIVLDIFSLFCLGQFISNEQSKTLEQALIQLTANYKNMDGCVIRVDHTPGFVALKNSKVLQSVSISLDFGRVKNRNKNPTIDRTIQEIEEEIKRLLSSGTPINPGSLVIAISNINNRIRMTALSSKEILLKKETIHTPKVHFERSIFPFVQRKQQYSSTSLQSVLLPLRIDSPECKAQQV